MGTQRFVTDLFASSSRSPRALLTAGTLVLGALALTACSQETYYCDATGCFRCDGVGCREVEPTSRTSCDCVDPCAAGHTCTDLGCTRDCDVDADCGDTGTVCAGGLCIGVRETATAVDCSCSATMGCAAGLICRDMVCVPGCESSADCASNEECIDGMCRPTLTPSCSDTNPCATGYTCVGGECRADEATCQFSSECGAGRICVDQHCTVGCDASSPCPTGAVCEAGYCREVIPPTGACVVNTDCAAGEICVDTSCYPECVRDTDCATGQYCLGTRCRFDDRPDPSCGPSAAMCAAGSVCQNGTCRVPCTASAECPLFDVQYTVCLRQNPTDVMGVCSTTNEATSDCAASADCAAGQECIDGICR